MGRGGELSLLRGCLGGGLGEPPAAACACQDILWSKPYGE